MSLPVFLTPEAQQDLRDIWRGLSEFGALKQADNCLMMIRKKLRLLGQFPSSGRSREDLLPGMRSVPVNSFLIFYRIGMTQVQIVRVVDGRRDLDGIFGEGENEQEDS